MDDLDNYSSYAPVYPYLNEGDLQCLELGINASFVSYSTCIIFKLPFKLEAIAFGHICAALLIPIIIISLFGKIQEQYRWFILHQAFWDFLISYDFICEKPSHSWFSGFEDYSINQGPSNCFYDNELIDRDVYYSTILFGISHISYLSLFLLTSSRFICLYFNHFYEQHNSNLKLILTIIFCNLIFFAILTLHNILGRVINEKEIVLRMYDEYQICTMCDLSCNETTQNECIANIDTYNFLWLDLFGLFKAIMPSILLVFSIVFSAAMISRVMKQLKFQAQHNRSKISSSLRVTIVCLIQCLMIIFMFGVTFIDNINTICVNSRTLKCGGIQAWYDAWPQWLIYLTKPSTIKCFNILRVFIDSILILLILNGYRRCWIVAFKYIICLQAFKKDKRPQPMTTMTKKVITIQSSRV